MESATLVDQLPELTAYHCLLGNVIPYGIAIPSVDFMFMGHHADGSAQVWEIGSIPTGTRKSGFRIVVKTRVTDVPKTPASLSAEDLQEIDKLQSTFDEGDIVIEYRFVCEYSDGQVRLIEIGSGINSSYPNGVAPLIKHTVVERTEAGWKAIEDAA